MKNQVLIVRKPGETPFVKRPTGTMRELIVEAANKNPTAVLIVAAVDDQGHIQVGSAQAVIDGHSSICAGD